MVNDIKCLGSKINCSISGLNLKEVDFYRAFTANGINFCTDDFVLFNDKNSVKIARLLRVYYLNEARYNSSPYRASVQWYIFAKDLDVKINNGSIQLHKTHEVVEHAKEHNVSITGVVRKCYIILGTVEDSKICIDQSNLDPNITFFCRYKIKENLLVPILCSPQKNQRSPDGLLYSIMNRENCDNMMVVVTSDTDKDSEDEHNHKTTASKKISKVKRKETSSITLDSEGSESEREMDVVKVKSPTSPSKSLKLSNTNVLKSSLNVKYNSLEKEKPITSPPPYSIIQSPNLENNSLRLKLRVMDYFRPVKVYPTQLDNEIIKTFSTIKVIDVMEKDNLIILSPTAKGDIHKTPSKSDIVEESRSLQRLCKMTPKYTPQRRSSRLSSQTKCNYVEQNSLILDDIVEENLVQSVNNISLHNTPKCPTRTSSRRSIKPNMDTPSSKTTPRRRPNLQHSKKLTNNEEPKSIKVTRSSVKKSYKKAVTSCNNESPETPLYTRIVPENLDSIKKKLKYDSDDDSVSTTPKQKPVKPSSKSCTRNTPSARAKMIREGIITPSVPSRNKAVLKVNTPLSKAQTQLHVSYIPKALSCRENEFDNISNFLTGKLFEGCGGGCMYISGVPGTGKTATVTEVIRGLEISAKNGDIPNFTYININCMRLSEPRQAYVEIAKQLTGKTIGWEQAQTLLEEKFAVSSKIKSLPIVLVVDELDILCNKRQDVVYTLLDWPTKTNVQLIVVAIANTMDLPERLLVGRVTSRLGLTRLTFQAYTHKQLQEIVTKRLTGTNTFDSDAIQLVARKVASVSGDARRALDICRRAAEIAETDGKFTLVSMKHVNQALTAMITQPKVQAIKHCCKLEQLLLQAIVAEIDRTGVEETNFQNVYQTFITVAALEGFNTTSITIVKSAIARLSACRLLLVDQKSCNIYQKIILNVSTDDIHYALK